MIRNDKELRHSKEKLWSSKRSCRGSCLSAVRQSETRCSAAVDALRMQIEDLEREISEYEDLKEGRLLSFGTEDLDSSGEPYHQGAHSPQPHAG